MYQQPPNQPPQWGQEPQQQPWQQPGQPYPQQPPQPPRKSRRGLWIILGILAAVLVFGCIGVVSLASRGAATNTNTNTNTGAAATAGSTSTATSAPAGHFKVGQVVNVGSTWQMTVISAKTSTGSEFYKPSSGNIYLIVTISLKNVSNSEQDVSSVIQFSLQDASGQKYTETIDPDAGATLDGKVEAGSPLKGAIVYEVPKAMHNFILAFEASITEPGQTIWDINV